ncbi:restriction endonuclease [Leclercia adecarboxylata]|uniref:restriction endonuclease n=1 Tax=Leclercia adecarboxylata TaxID=83655 RepID=UPI00102E9B0F|nr:restriction endonuclease [Leclercia adecarboxylata]MCE9980120.1 restriction endonuclease [Leclercia adecarboxylata]QBF86447.1 restriction endonuclease [Leclercia adecarboxylata]
MDTLVKLATIASPLVSAGVAIWAILVAKATISESKEIAKKTIADTAYQAYLQLAMENPQFSKGYIADSSQDRDPMYDQYVWYVARMIFCFEKIIEVEGNLKDSSWANTLEKHLKFHSAHFKKTKVVEETLYISPILDLIRCATN